MPSNIDFRECILRVKKVEGVEECIVFKDGMPIESQGENSEHISAVAEDLTRAGLKLAEELGIGRTKDIILETPEKKLLIYPVGDAYIGVIARADVNLGLLRLVLESFGD